MKDQAWEETGEKYREGQDFERSCVAVSGEWGTEGSHWKVLDARDPRSSQDLTGMTVAEIPNKEETEPAETISSG